MAERGDGPNHHAFGTFVTHPAVAGSAPKASGDRSSRTLAQNMSRQFSPRVQRTVDGCIVWALFVLGFTSLASFVIMACLTGVRLTA